MSVRSIKPGERSTAIRVEQLLESHYGRLRNWCMALTRGDVGKAEEIVQEFCLYLALTKPDLSGVANLDGYFYTCLRNLYQSTLARSSREAIQFVSAAEFDSIRFALARSRGGDTLQRQNDLRRICGYAVWRKEQSKSFSYFILHFFHGYFRREVAEMAGVSLSMIYNKLHSARAEMRAHLEETGRLRIATRDLPPELVQLWHQIPAPELFKELRKSILDARNSLCLSEEHLLAYYRGSVARPLPSSLLSHLASCERCLAIVDRHFRRPTLQDREPLDSTGSIEDSMGTQETSMGTTSYTSLLQAVDRRLNDMYEHRPRTLSIAVNGKIIAFHDVQGQRSTLAARIEEKARFIEVFSEQDVRFALLPVSGAPPDGPHTVTQHVELSDERWLELNLVFDGLGLNSEVAYFDPVLAIAAEEMEVEDEEAAFIPGIPDQKQAVVAPEQISQWSRYMRWLRPRPMLAWGMVVALAFCLTSYFAYHDFNRSMSAPQLLSQSVMLEANTLRGQTAHQVLQVEEVAANGHVLQQGTVDVWKDGDGARYMRRLYDSQHHLVAANWEIRNTTHTSHSPSEAADFSGIPWNQDISARAFNVSSRNEPEIRRTKNGYELTVAGPTAAQPHLVSATLVINRRLLAVGEVMRMRGETGVYEVRFAQTSYTYSPSRSVPDTVFEPEDSSRSSHSGNTNSSLFQPFPIARSTQLAELKIAVLYQLSQIDADTGEPIEVASTADGRVRIFGAVTDDTLKKEIVPKLEDLPNHQLLDIRLASQSSAQIDKLRSLRQLSGSTSTYEAGSHKPPADPLVRRYFEEKSFTGTRVDTAAAQFSGNILTLAQHALQNAYALDRLGSVLSGTEVDALNLSAREQWAKMAEKHASALEAQTISLNAQLSNILPEGQQADIVETPGTIETAAEFARSARHLLLQIQEVNHNIDSAFASGEAPEKGENVAALLASTAKMLPVRQTEMMAKLTQRLGSSADTTMARKHAQRMEMPVAPR